MRQARLKAPAHLSACYHCVCRITGRQPLLDEPARDEFVRIMRMYERLCGVRVLTYAVMSDHVHLLIEVPPPPDEPLSTVELLKIIRDAYGKERARAVLEELEAFGRAGKRHKAQAVIDGWLDRMWDISPFMKTVKQRFTQWYNKTHERSGTIWENRYRSALVEATNDALTYTAAYIDLNAVRAGLVTNPADYRWCGYAEAVAGDNQAKAGIKTAAAPLAANHQLSPIAAYEALMNPTEDLGTSARLSKRILKGERLTPAELLRTRVRYFTDGAVIGGKEFVNSVFKAERKRFSPRRKDGARLMRGVEKDTDLCTMRDLRKNVFG